VRDDEDAHRDALARALECDVVVSSGGVSVGRTTSCAAVAEELGVEEVFWRVAVKPGKPISFGVRDATLRLRATGQSRVDARRVRAVRPAGAARSRGRARPRPTLPAGALARPVRRNDAATSSSARAGRTARLEALGGQESHMIVRAAAADALVLVPRGEGELAGEVSYLPLG
jgi:molybdopterin molybdotransferase